MLYLFLTITFFASTLCRALCKKKIQRCYINKVIIIIINIISERQSALSPLEWSSPGPGRPRWRPPRHGVIAMV